MYPPLQAAILPAWAKFLDSDGYLADNGLVSWEIDAVPQCPISGGYRTRRRGLRRTPEICPRRLNRSSWDFPEFEG